METESLFDDRLTDRFLHRSTVVVRRQLLYQKGLFDESFSTHGDYDLWLRLALAAEAGCVPEPLVFVRRHAFAYSRQLDILHCGNAILILERLRRTYSLNPRQWLISRAAISRLHTYVGLSRLEVNQVDQARRHFVRSLCWNPLQRRARVALKRRCSAEA
jgi:hypothetical protein